MWALACLTQSVDMLPWFPCVSRVIARGNGVRHILWWHSYWAHVPQSHDLANAVAQKLWKVANKILLSLEHKAIQKILLFCIILLSQNVEPLTGSIILKFICWLEIMEHFMTIIRFCKILNFYWFFNYVSSHLVWFNLQKEKENYVIHYLFVNQVFNPLFFNLQLSFKLQTDLFS